MINKDILKETIKNKLERVLDIPVKITTLKQKIETRDIFPKMIFMERVGDLMIRVVDYEIYDKMGVEKPPVLENIVGLYICNATSKSLISSYDEVNGIVVTETELAPMVESIDELIIESEAESTDTEDCVYITSLHSFNNRKSANLVEVFRRFELGLFCYDDDDEAKCNHYMELIRDEFDKDFQLEYETKRGNTAYINSPMRFDVVENGKLNRIVYGSIMLKTYK
ncbi:MAG: hypothetical protein ACRC5T_11950 [Cetobacterium sp.]